MTRGYQRALPLLFAVAAFVLAILQRPGWSSSDTKIDLHTDPARFLGDVASVWTPTGGLGGVESAQYAGYLWPMGPFFAALHALGISDWLADRLWLGLILALGCWGVIRLGDALFGRQRGIAHAVAAAMYLLNPYVVVFTNRTTVTLLAYAALPWLVLFAHRGLRMPRAWLLPAAFALVVTSAGAGVNAAVVAFILIGPALLLLYEPLIGDATWRAAGSFAWRAGVATLGASLWWIAPILVQGRYGIDFLRFTEPAGAIWATTSLPESLRLMGYWIAYIGVGFQGVVRPYFSDAGVMLFQPLVVVATLAVPGLALSSFAWTRRHRHAPYLLGLVLVGALLMTIGFPEGTPLRRGVTFAYNHFPSVRFLRTTYKAGPLVALGLAGLGGLGAAAAADWLRGRRRLALVAAAAGVALLVLAAWPLVRGRAIDHQVSWKRIPPAWTAAARDLDRTLPHDQRAIVLPGDLYAFYRWGGTVDPILPVLARSPVAERNAVPYGDLHGTDLLWTTDALVQQQRLVPGELQPLLRLLGAGAAVAGTDDDYHRSGAADPAAAAQTLAAQGLGRAPASYGPLTRFPPPAGELGPGAVLPQVRRYDVPSARPIVRVESPRPVLVVDGSAQGLADVAAFGGLGNGALGYASDLGGAPIRAATAEGAEIAVTDSNRRRIFVVSRVRQNTGATLAAADPISEDAAVLNPFPEKGTGGQTVAVLHGAKSVRAPFSPGFAQFPENGPFAAFDGDAKTYWLADPALDPARQYVEIDFVKPLDIASVSVLPRAEAGATPVGVAVGGHTFVVHPGWNRLRVGLHGATSLRVRVITRRGRSAAAAGLAEVRVPGVRVTRSLRPPTVAESALRGVDLSHTALDYVFERETGDAPFRRDATSPPPIRRVASGSNALEAQRVRDPGDAEARLDRVFDPPAARAWLGDAWVSLSPGAPDSAIDRLLGYAGSTRIDSSSRFEGRAELRGSAALDNDVRSAWVGRAGEGQVPWLRWRTPAQHTISALTILPPADHMRVPTEVELVWPSGNTGPLPVVSGRVKLPRPATSGEFTLRILRSAFPVGTSPRERFRQAVGIAELRGTGVAPVAVNGPPPLQRCGGVFADVGSGRLRFRVDAAALASGQPMRARSCGPPLELPAKPVRLITGGSLFQTDLLRLRSAAPDPRTARITPGRVVSTGAGHRASRDGVRVAVTEPATLVLGESFSSGWRAYCDGRSLGSPHVADGYANGWDVKPPCTNVRFAFAPNKPVHWVQLLSALVCLILVAVVLLGARRRPAEDRLPTPQAYSAEGSAVGARRALALALFAAAVLGFCFSIRSGLAIFVGVAVIVWLGIGPRVLAAVAGALLTVVVPVLYLLFPAADEGGYNPSYAGDQIAAHWVAVAAFTLLVIALVQMVSTATRRGAGEARSGP